MASVGKGSTLTEEESITLYGKQYKILSYEALKGDCFGFIYVTVNDLTGKKYLGMHNSWKKNYLGSGTYLLHAIVKYGRENFTRYIIDTADSYKELVELEADYITSKFNVNLAESEEWYNITSGLQRGGNTWAGMTEEARKLRSERISTANKGRRMTEEQIEYNRTKALEWYSDPNNRTATALATKKAMYTPEVQAKLRKPKSVKPVWSLERMERAQKLMSELGKVSRPAWNKGKPMTEEHKKKLSESMSPIVTATLGGETLINKESIEGAPQGIADKITELTGIKIGKHAITAIAESGKPFEPKIPRQEGLRGLQVYKESYLDRKEERETGVHG